MRVPTSSTLVDVLDLVAAVRDRGYVHIRQTLGLDGFRALAAEIGHVVGEEAIELRDGAHAYVAQPGAVPFHTDQAQVEIIGWLCRDQDQGDGASLLLDSRGILADMAPASRDRLRRVKLACPPVVGGPPAMAVPVIREFSERHLFFCSPWLDPIDGTAEAREALGELGSLIETRSRTDTIRIRLEPGESLFIDNQRVMHGRSELPPTSRRRLHRIWIITRAAALLE